MIRPAPAARRRRRIAAGLAVIAVLLGVARLALEPLLERRVRTGLAALDGMHGTFAGVEVQALRLTYAIRGLRIEQAVEGGRRVPLLEVERARFGLSWRELLRWRRAGWAELDRPVLHVLQRRQPRPAAPPGAPQHVDEAPRGGRRLAGLAPFRVDRTQVRDGRILFARASAPETPILRIHGVELVIERFAPPGAPAGRHRLVLTARATLQRSGRISLFATADPGAARPAFSGHARLDGLRFDELGATLARTGVEPDGGVLAMVVRFGATDGRISGDVRPILSAAGTRPADPGIASHLKSFLADGSLDQFREDVRGGADPAITTIRLDGTVKDPAAHPVTAIVGVLRNAFVVGLTAALRGPPPAATVEPPGEPGQARRPPPRGGRGRQATAR